MSDSTDDLQKQYDEALKEEVLELANFKKALEEEFRTKNLEDPETIAATKGHVVDMVPDAATQLKWLIKHAESESVRANLSKWIMELAMKRAERNEEDEALKEFLKGITIQPTPTKKEQADVVQIKSLQAEAE